ncbi:hypothetical protein [Pseudomonas arsenicoxydans]|uniref:Uncharacterized protein n=1 Tax=Pseudomonas arsenicoxydans TaxID=702115 RepID=A0A502HRR1_9PSED|nr:hypothetical protein [Pseudomonas arsenicoxydans]TPG76344.1 hypothetical protein EAH78_18460 [Pseudomonas arsenicoxydans]
MSPIAQHALDRAQGEPVPISCPETQLASVLDDIAPPLDISAIDISGPINQVMFLEGQNFALDMVRSAGAALSDPPFIAKLVQNLIRAALSRPPSYAKGIKTVTELLLQQQSIGSRPTTHPPRSPRTLPDQN